MQLASKLKIENIGSLASIAFYGLVGIILLILMAMSGFPPHVGLMGITSIIAAYGIFKKRFWSIWLVVALFFVANTFSIFTLYYVSSTDAIATAAMLAYAILTWIFTAYALATRTPAEA